MISPAALRIGATVTCTGVRRPSFRLANTSGAPLPNAGDHRAMQRTILLAAEFVAVLVDVGQQDLSKQSRPSMSSADQPVIRSAAWFQYTMRRSTSVT